MKQTFLITDTHLGHENILGFCREEWNSIEEHDQAILDLWNDRVKPEDHVIHMGDVAWDNASMKRLKSLPGRKSLILGNHDKRCGIGTMAEVFSGGVLGSKAVGSVIISHYPLSMFSERYSDNYYNIHGHTHLNGSPPGLYLSLCCEITGEYGPTPLEEAIEQVRKMGSYDEARRRQHRQSENLDQEQARLAEPLGRYAGGGGHDPCPSVSCHL